MARIFDDIYGGKNNLDELNISCLETYIDILTNEIVEYKVIVKDDFIDEYEIEVDEKTYEALIKIIGEIRKQLRIFKDITGKKYILDELNEKYVMKLEKDINILTNKIVAYKLRMRDTKGNKREIEVDEKTYEVLLKIIGKINE